MLNLKKAALAVLALGSSAVFAGTMGPVCAPVAVTVPCESTAWDFGVRALYLQHRGQDDFGFRFRRDSDENRFDFNTFDSQWNWGFMLEASYHFSNGNDVNINWYHWNQSNDFDDDDFALRREGTDSLFGDFRHRHNPSWDAVNFEFGQLVNFGEHKVIRFHGGAQYVNLQRQHRWDARRLDDSDFVGRVHERNEEFNGFGPRVGMDMSYHFGNGFAIYANGATALLVGQNSFDSRFNNNFGTGFNNRFNRDRDNLVPELEAKLGAMYDYATGNGEFILDAGWLVVNYFSPLRTFNTGDTDFNLNGPYFGAKWIGNVA